ncbi:MAG: hypothetical protein ACE14Q_07775, partial [Acidobacteriota bacterium]
MNREILKKLLLLTIIALVCIKSANIASQQHSSALSFGDNSYGQLSSGNNINSFLPVLMLNSEDSIKIKSCNHNLLLTANGKVKACGYNYNGQVGDGTNNNKLSFVELNSLENIVDIAVGKGHSLALKSDGTVWAWGSNYYGQLGDGTNVDKNIPVMIPNFENVIKIAAGDQHSLAIKSDGTVWSWGCNESGQLGTGGYYSSNSPVLISGLNDVVDVIGGNYHSLAVKTNGEVWAWGYNGYGQLGDGTNNSSSIPVKVINITGIVSVKAGQYFSLALGNDGKVWAWGANGYGQLGNGTYTNSNTPQLVLNLENIVQIDCKSYHVISLRNDGTVWGWGYNGYYQLGSNDVNSINVPYQINSLNNVAFIAAGFVHTAVITRCNDISIPPQILSIANYGDNCDGVMIYFSEGSPATRHDLYVDGILRKSDILSPCYFNPLDTQNHDYSIKAINSFEVCYSFSPIYSFSDPVNGTPSAPILQQIVDISPQELSGIKIYFEESSQATSYDLYVDGVLKVEGFWSGDTFQPLDSKYHRYKIRAKNGNCFSDSNMLLGRDKEIPSYSTLVFSWGDNWVGQLGNGTNGPNRKSYVPTMVLNSQDMICVSAGENFSLGLRKNGTVWGWGSNNRGQLGTGNNLDYSWPAPVSNLTNIEYITAGVANSFAIDNMGHVWGWGLNSSGQLGNGSKQNSNIPVQAINLQGAIMVSAGNYHSIALTNDGHLWSWGYNGYGALGNGTYQDSLIPQMVTYIDDVISISAGRVHSLALKSDGTVWAWGYNNEGQLGTGDFTNKIIPTQVNSLSDVIEIGANEYCSYAIKSDGTLWMWGNLIKLPTQIIDAENVLHCSSGLEHVMIMKMDSSVWSWGNNYYGQLGTGLYEDASVPTRVAMLGKCLAIAAGNNHSLAVNFCESPAYSPEIISINNSPDSCGGVIIVFNNGAPATKHDLYVDGIMVKENIQSPVYFNPQDNLIHSYVIKATNEESFCYNESPAYQYSNTGNPTPSKPVITSIEDQSSTLLNGVRIFYQQGAPATSHDLYVDGILKQQNFSSGNTYYPQDAGPHYYIIRAINGSCFRDSDLMMAIDKTTEDFISSVFAWGQNRFAQLGLGDKYRRYVPSEIPDLNNAVQVAGTAMQSYALKSDGTVWGWGYNENRMLGRTDCPDSYCTSPGPCPGLTNFVQISGKLNHLLALKNDGTVWGWGDNTYGQLGDGTSSGSVFPPVKAFNLTEVIYISAGVNFSLALKADGTVWAWGDNNTGQLGDGTYERSLIPIRVNGIKDIIAISAGAQSSYAVDINGDLWAWGGYILGDGYYRLSNIPIKISTISDIKNIAAGTRYIYAVKKDGTAWQWGGKDSRLYLPTQITQLSNIDTVDNNYENAIFLDESKNCWTVGNNWEGQRGTGDQNDYSYPTKVLNLSNVDRVSFGTYHALAVVHCSPPETAPILNSIVDSEDRCEGIVINFTPSNDASRHDLYVDGILAIENVGNPVQYNPMDKISHTYKIRAIKDFYKCYLDSNAVVFADVKNDVPTKPVITSIEDLSYESSSGIRIYFNPGFPAERHDLYVDGIKKTENVYNGYIHIQGDSSLHYYQIVAVYSGCMRASEIFLARDAGFVYLDNYALSWGCNYHGELGDGTNQASYVPILVSNISNVIQISAGEDFSLALKGDGTVWAWGYNYFGQLGTGDKTNRNIPTQISTINGIVKICAGVNRALALQNNGTVWMWGDNTLTPTQVANLNGIVDVSMGNRHFVALKNDGTIWVWGSNSNGQLGLGYFEGNSVSIPVQVPNIQDVIGISANSDFTLIIKGDGSVWGCGENEAAELGSGDMQDYCSFHKVAILEDVNLVSAGYDHALAVKTDGTLWSWGSNTSGELGDGTHYLRKIPVYVSGIAGVSKIDGGDEFSLALLSDGRVYSFGSNSCGKLGIGQNGGSYCVPVEIPNLLSVEDISAGNDHALAIKSSCEVPSSPHLLGISDNNICFSDGITLTFSTGFPSTRHDLYKDNLLVASSVISPYQFNPGDSNQHSYKVRAINYSDNCFADSEILSYSDQASSIKPIINGSTTNICPAQSISLTTQTGKTNYQWYKEGVAISGANSYQYSATESGSYSVSFTDENNCTSTSNPHTVTIVSCIPNIMYQSKGG